MAAPREAEGALDGDFRLPTVDEGVIGDDDDIHDRIGPGDGHLRAMTKAKLVQVGQSRLRARRVNASSIWRRPGSLWK